MNKLNDSEIEECGAGWRNIILLWIRKQLLNLSLIVLFLFLTYPGHWAINSGNESVERIDYFEHKSLLKKDYFEHSKTLHLT